MTEKTLTTENIKPALDALRGELAPWPVMAMKQDRLNDTQKSAVNSGITSSLVAQIIANTAAIRALESAITGTGLRALVVASLPAVGTTGILYIVPVTTYDPDTDADVVNYSNEYIWIPVEGGQASEGHYEQVGQTGIVINNGQLTITVNGTSVGTFTANQSGDTTAAITVPTNADYVDLSTDQTVAGKKTWTGEQSFTLPIVGSITGTASKAIADEDGTSIKTGYVNVAGNQTVTGDKSFTGSNTFNNILPNATNTYSLGSSSYQWSSVYAQTYYYNGTAWGLDKVNEWSNTNRFLTSITLKNTSLEKGVVPSPNFSSRTFYFTDKNNADLATIIARTNPSGSSYLSLVAGNLYKNGTMDSTGSAVYSGFYIGTSAEGKPFCDSNADLFPEYNNTYNLGTSTNKWKSIYADSYYYGTTAWGLDKANVWSQNQSVTNAVTPKFILQDTRNDRTYSASTTLSGGVMRWECDDKDGAPLSRISTTLRGDKVVQLQLAIFNEDSTGAEFDRTIRFAVGNTGSAVYYPEQTGNVDLGDSSHKWKTLNGVNPGALSLPDTSNSVVVDTTDWVYDGLTANLIKFNNAVQTFSGWLYITAQNTSASDRIVVRYIGSDASNLTFIGGKFDSATSIFVACPIVAGVSTYVWSTKALNTIKIYKALGNV